MALDYDKDYVVDLVKGIREAEYLCDVTLVAGMDGRRFPVHRNVMVASSPYFKALLGPNYREANLKEIPLSAFNGEMLQTIVNYCYSGSIRINNENVGDITSAASSLELVQLEEKCADFLDQQLCADSSIKILLIADQYNLMQLRNKALNVIFESFDKVPPGDMVKLDERIFAEILKGDKIAADETSVFDRLVQWVEHDASNRSQLVASLANSIRLEHVPTEFLSERVESFYENNGCGELVVNEKNKRKRNRGPACPRRYQPDLYCANFDEEGGITIFKYVGRRFVGIRTVPIETPRENRIFSSGKAYLFDDATEGVGITMESYDLLTSEKDILPDLPLNSILDSPISIGKHIYILGKNNQASTQHAPFTSFYRFDTERQLWETLEPLPHRMKNLSVIEMDGLIYVAGEVQRTQNYASSFWCYTPYRNVWMEKCHADFEGQNTILLKTKNDIFICNKEAGFRRYRIALNRWTELSLDIATPDRQEFKEAFHEHCLENPTYNLDYYDCDSNFEAIREFELNDAIPFGDKTFGILNTENGDFFVDIVLRDNHCEFKYPFDDDYLEELGFSEEAKHLFIH